MKSKKTKKTEALRAPLSRERAIAEAVALADAGGLAELSMRRLAQALGVEAMSLYHHVTNKDDILNGMVDFVFARIELPVPSDDWRAVMRSRCESVRATLKHHRWALGLLESRQQPGPATLKHHDAVIGCLRHAGFSLPLTGHAYALIDSYTYGFVMQELNLPLETPTQTSELAGAIMGQLPQGAFTNLVEFTIGHVLKPGYAYAHEFAWGLELVLDGLQRRLDEERGAGRW